MKEVSKSVNPLVIRLSGYRQFCELLSLLSLTMGICGFLLLDEAQRWSWVLACLIGLLFFLGLAFYFGLRAILEFIDAEFSITRKCVLALEKAQAPKDLIDCLNDLSPATFIGEQDYFLQLSSILTPVRCAELKETIFNYTYIGRKKETAHSTQSTNQVQTT